MIDELPPGSPDLAGSDHFVLTFADGKRQTSATLSVVRGPVTEVLPAVPPRGREPGRAAGQQTTVALSGDDGALAVTWRRWVRRDLPVIHQELTLTARDRAVPVTAVSFFALPASGTTVGGTVDGSPLLRDNAFFAVEHPMAKATIAGGTAQVTLARPQPVRHGHPDVIRAAVGVAADAGQLRRVFRAYVERGRAHPHRPFLQYNSWFDVSWAGKTLTAAECLAAIEAIGAPLGRREVALDAFVFDDGWDAPGTLWEINRVGFPDGFAPLAAAARRLGSGIGVWMSPWGGYDPAKADRLAVGRRAGFLTSGDGLSLADPAYFARFRDTAAAFVARDRVRYLKFDGVTARDPDQTEALFRLIAELRALSPTLFVNVTVGTWPSPFWLWHADSIWRGGDDLGFAGTGDKREQWITYRDAQVYRNVVVPAPLFPLSALMTHGVVNGQHGPGAEMARGGAAFAHEVRSYFGSGVALQELYVTPSRMGADDWDVLAEAAVWARRRAPVLADSAWVGGDPAAGEIYGWASFAADGARTGARAVRGVLVLRCPRDRPGQITLDVGTIFQLPSSAPRRYTLSSPWRGDSRAPLTVEAGAPHTFSLRPFEVLVLEARAAR